jgi:hypothetical protein
MGVMVMTMRVRMPLMSVVGGVLVPVRVGAREVVDVPVRLAGDVAIGVDVAVSAAGVLVHDHGGTRNDGDRQEEKEQRGKCPPISDPARAGDPSAACRHASRVTQRPPDVTLAASRSP